MKETLKQRLFAYFGIDEQQYQDLIAPTTLLDFAVGHHFDDIEEASELVKNAIKEGQKIAIYGDYDADGIMGTSILVKMFSYVGVSTDYYIPSRYLDGYGLTLKYAKKAVENNIGLLITVDNGVSALEPIKYLRENGVDVLVLDHHNIPDILPPANYIIHPTYSHFGNVASSGGFTAFMFSIVFLGRTDKYLATLASISLITDMMPLLEYNRRLLKAVIASYKEQEFLSIDLLKDNDPFDENSIGMKIGPRINALGRMIEDESINKIVEYFTSDDPRVILNYKDWIFSTNEERKTASKESADEIKNVSTEDGAIVYITQAKEGILGLIANNLCSTYHLPTIVFALESDGNILKGSCRAPQGYNVIDIFNALKDLMLTFGGHSLAGGCSIKVEDFDVFKKRFIAYCKSVVVEQYVEKTILLGLNEITFDNYKLINSFSPFGESWPSPLFAVNHILTSSLTFSRTGEHIMSYISQGVKLTGFFMPRNEVSQYRYIDVKGKMKTSVYRGLTSLDFLIKEYQESKK